MVDKKLNEKILILNWKKAIGKRLSIELIVLRKHYLVTFVGMKN